MKLIHLPLLLAAVQSCYGSLMSRIGLTLGGRPAHENQLDHTRRIPWAVKEMMEEEQRQQNTLPFIKKPVSSEDNEGRPPPCVGICYYQKLQALQAREELTKHNQILKEDCDSDECLDPRIDLEKTGIDLTDAEEDDTNNDTLPQEEEDDVVDNNTQEDVDEEEEVEIDNNDGDDGEEDDDSTEENDSTYKNE